LNNVAFHAEHPVHNNQFAGVLAGLLEAVFQSGHVIVGKPNEFPGG
jgi:hypothetical protein